MEYQLRPMPPNCCLKKGLAMTSLHIFSLLLSLSLTQLVSSAPSEYCYHSLKYYFDDNVRPVMEYLCALQLGQTKTFADVGLCVESVKTLCWNECEASTEDGAYQNCVFDPYVSEAYKNAEVVFLDCIGAETTCIRIKKDWKIGKGCWQECFKERSAECTHGCKPVTDLSSEALKYMKCALKMNSAHLAFKDCIYKKIPLKL